LFKYFNKYEYYQIDGSKFWVSNGITCFRTDAKNKAFEKGMGCREEWKIVSRGGPQSGGSIMQAREQRCKTPFCIAARLSRGDLQICEKGIEQNVSGKIEPASFRGGTSVI
jgi:hypothetical protein